MAEGQMNDRRTSIVLISKTGGGKSSLANALLDTTEFMVARGMMSGTVYCKCISTHARERDLTVVDTPGTMDVSDEERAKSEIMRAISFCPDGFDIFMVVVKCDSRFTAEEQRAIEIAADMFGKSFYSHAIVVFSYGDTYDNNLDEFNRDLMRFRQNIPYLDELLKKCSNRYVLVDNGRRCDRDVQGQQLDVLLALVDNLMSRNSYAKYTNELFQSHQREQERAETVRREEENRRRQEERDLIAREARQKLEAVQEVYRIARDCKEQEAREDMERRATVLRQMMLINLAGAGVIMAMGMTSISQLQMLQLLYLPRMMQLILAQPTHQVFDTRVSSNVQKIVRCVSPEIENDSDSDSKSDQCDS